MIAKRLKNNWLIIFNDRKETNEWFLAIGNLTGKIFKVGIYIRLSREDGDKLESESVQNQRDILQRYVKENQYILVDEYIDDGVSRYNLWKTSISEND